MTVKMPYMTQEEVLARWPLGCAVAGAAWIHDWQGGFSPEIVVMMDTAEKRLRIAENDAAKYVCPF